MVADAGDDILLSYGPQGEPQLGDDILLSYTSARPRRRLIATFQSRWGRAAPGKIEVVATYGAVQPSDRELMPSWRRGRRQDAEQVHPWGATESLDQSVLGLWPSFGRALQPDACAAWRGARARDASAELPWPGFQGKGDRASVHPWLAAIAQDRQAGAPWGGPMRWHTVVMKALVPRAKRRDRDRYLPWSRYSRQLAPGWGVVSPGGDAPDPGDGLVIPIRRFYLVQNDVFISRVDDGTRLHASTLQLSGNRDSWTYTWSASLAAADLDAVMSDSTGEPVLVEASINGQAFRLLVEDVERDRVYPSRTLSVSGRGWSAALDESALERTFGSDEARTAAQLMDEALMVNGVPLGWAVDFQLIDWLVPAGAWSHQGSPISALNAIAAAAGGYLQPHPDGYALRVLPVFPVKPWELGAAEPDISLPSVAVVREGLRWQRRPAYNRVFVSGQQGGRRGVVTRAGTAGDVLAPQVVDALLTHADAARQRGIAELGKGGAMATIALRLQVLPEVGVIHPGKVLEYMEGSGPGATVRRGFTRSFAVDYAFPKLRQAITVDTFPLGTP